MLCHKLNRSVPSVPNFAGASEVVGESTDKRPKPDALNVARHAIVSARHGKSLAAISKKPAKSELLPLIGRGYEKVNWESVSILPADELNMRSCRISDIGSPITDY